MKILDRYILKEFLLPLMWCLFVFVSLYIIVDLFAHLDDIIKKSISINLVLNYYISFVPSIFVQTSPVATLVSCVYALTKLSQSNEIMAMRSAGVSLRRVILPLAILGLVISGIVFFVNEELIPQSLNTLNRVKEHLASTDKTNRAGILNNIAVYGKNDRLYYIKSLNPKTGFVEDITVLEHDENRNLTARIFAERGQWFNETNSWIFYNCTIYNLNPQGEIIGTPIKFKERLMDIQETANDFIKPEIKLKFMRYAKLKEYLTRFAKAGENRLKNRLSVELYNKFAFSMASFIMIIIGSACALNKRQTHSIWGGFGISLAIGFLYYAVMSISITLGKNGIMPALISVWFANIVFGGAALVLLLRSR